MGASEAEARSRTDEVAGDQTIVVSLREMIENHELPPSYYDHPVVLENPYFDVLPLQIFVDGLQ